MRHVTVPLAWGSVTDDRSPSGQVHVSKPAAFLSFSPSAQYCSVSRSGDQPFSLSKTSAQSRGTSSNSEICLTLASIILATSSAPIKTYAPSSTRAGCVSSRAFLAEGLSAMKASPSPSSSSE